MLRSSQANSTLTYPVANATGASVLEEGISQNSSIARVIPGQHMIGTTTMGTNDGTKNGSSVVDTNCKVHGTSMSN